MMEEEPEEMYHFLIIIIHAIIMKLATTMQFALYSPVVILW